MTAAGSPGGTDHDHDSDGMVALLPTADDAARLAVGNTDPHDLHLTLCYLPDVGDFDDPQALADMFTADGPLTGDVNGNGILGGGTAQVWLVNVPGLTAARNDLVDAVSANRDAPDPSADFDGFLPHITHTTGDDRETSEDQSVYGPVTFDRLRVSLRGNYTDLPLGSTQGVSAGPDEIPESLSESD